jgi:hypothetical protein
MSVDFGCNILSTEVHCGLFQALVSLLVSC